MGRAGNDGVLKLKVASEAATRRPEQAARRWRHGRGTWVHEEVRTQGRTQRPPLLHCHSFSSVGSSPIMWLSDILEIESTG